MPRTALPEVLREIESSRAQLRAARGQRLPRRRRQPAPARALRRRVSRRGRAARRGAGRGDPRGVRRARRLDHGRARRRRRQGVLHAAHVQRGPIGDAPARALRLRPRPALQPRQGLSDAAPLRRGARPLSTPSRRGSRAGGAVLVEDKRAPVGVITPVGLRRNVFGDHPDGDGSQTAGSPQDLGPPWNRGPSCGTSRRRRSADRCPSRRAGAPLD